MAHDTPNFKLFLHEKQTGDPAKLARALVTVSGLPERPLRFIAGADAIGTAEQNIAELTGQISGDRDLLTSLAIDSEPWTLRDYFTSGKLDQHLIHSALVHIVTLEAFVRLANSGKL